MVSPARFSLAFYNKSGAFANASARAHGSCHNLAVSPPQSGAALRSVSAKSPNDHVNQRAELCNGRRRLSRVAAFGFYFSYVRLEEKKGQPVFEPATQNRRSTAPDVEFFHLVPLRLLEFLRRRARLTLLIMIAAPVPLLAAWLLASPAEIFSREMSWDLLFNLEGAWHLYNGQIAHVDFHNPLGVLSFALTDIGLWLVGVRPQAFLAGALIYSGCVFLAAVSVLWRRLPAPAAAVAVVYITLLALAPINIGDGIASYSFAMAYNRYGWSAIVLLFLILFLPPRRGDDSSWTDQCVGFALLLLLFYLKITYFLLGIGAVIAALALAPHIRKFWAAWLSILALTVTIIAAPANFPYWRDIGEAIASGAIRDDAGEQVKAVLANPAEAALVAAQLLGLFWLWRRGRIGVEVLWIAALAVLGGLFLLSQNAQAGGVPLYFVVSFLLCDGLCGLRDTWRRNADTALRLGVVLMPPAVAVLAMVASLCGYHAKALDPRAMVIADTNLRGLAVPATDSHLLEAFSQGRVTSRFLNAARTDHPRYELSQSEYVETVLEAARLLRARGAGEATQPKIMVLDSVNPLPFILGITPPHNTDLWLDPIFPWLPADEALADVDYVLIPKFPTHSAATDMAIDRYGRYLQSHFAFDSESLSWIVFARTEGRSIAGDN
jgi:hypothetical protein